MRRVPNMIMVGGRRRGAGKTELACALISALVGRGLAVVGVKVVTVRPGDRDFHLDAPRREELMAGRLSHVLIEDDEHSGGDTARMLAAGAGRALRLIVSSDHLPAAVDALLAVVAGAGAVVCESNSLRLAVEPGRFVMVDGPADGALKPGAEAAMRFAHEEVPAATRYDEIARTLAAGFLPDPGVST